MQNRRVREGLLGRLLERAERLGESLLKPCRYAFRNSADFFPALFSENRAFPDDADTPALPQKLRDVAQIPRSVARELRFPKFAVRRGHFEFRTAERIERVLFQDGRRDEGVSAFPAVRVPEASVYEDDGAVMRKNDVRASLEPPVVFAEPEAEPEKRGAERDLKLSAGATYVRHIFVPLLFCQVCHSSLSDYLLYYNLRRIRTYRHISRVNNVNFLRRNMCSTNIF